VPNVVGGEVRSEVSNEGVQRVCTEDLDCMFLLRHLDEVWASNDFETCRFKRVIQLTESLLSAIAGYMMKFDSRLRFVGDFGDIMIKSLSVLKGAE
jgi:hypothetical protein